MRYPVGFALKREVKEDGREPCGVPDPRGIAYTSCRPPGPEHPIPKQSELRC